MQSSKNIYKWISKEENRKNVLVALCQPLTARQLNQRTGLNRDSCSHVVSTFVARGLGVCLNPQARNSRLYWLTDLGRRCQKSLCQKAGRSGSVEMVVDSPDVDWELYGWVCFRHRAGILRILREPMQPSEMKRCIRLASPRLKISANNIRDVIRLFLKKGLVQKVLVRKKAHPRYELTERGQAFQKLLLHSGTLLD